MQVYLSEHIAPSAYARLARHFEIVDNFVSMQCVITLFSSSNAACSTLS